MFYNLKDIEASKHKIKKVFFYRICGTGMGTTAILLKDMGYEVAGYDVNYFSPMKEVLQSNNITCYQDSFDYNIIKEYDLVVIGNTVSKNSEEVQKLDKLDIIKASFSAVLGGLVLAGRHVVGIAGTHGKTTTTYIAAQIFKKLGKDIGYFIGGVINNASSGYLGRDKWFFIESDEYDSAYFEKFSKFHNYKIKDLILTSLEFDHADIFSSLADIELEFKKLLTSLPKDKLVILNSDYPAALKLDTDLKLNAKKFGASSFKIIKTTASETQFQLELDKVEVPFTTNLIGVQNILNLASVIYYVYYQKIASLSDLQNAVKDLKLLKRRQEFKGVYKGVPFIDDFAHHPTAVKLTIDAVIDSYPGKKVKVVFAPASATARSNLFTKEFLDSLQAADDVIFVTPNKTTVKNAETMNMVEMATMLGKGNVVSTSSELIATIESKLEKDALFLILTNGPCLNFWESDFASNIKK